MFLEVDLASNMSRLNDKESLASPESKDGFVSWLKDDMVDEVTCAMIEDLMNSDESNKRTSILHRRL